MQATTTLSKGDIAHIQRTALGIPPVQRTVRRSIYGHELLAMGYETVNGEAIEVDRYYAIDTIREESVVLLLAAHCRDNGMQALPAIVASLRDADVSKRDARRFVQY